MALNEGILEGGKAGAKKRRRRWVKFHASLLALKMQHFVFGNTSTLTPKTVAAEVKGNGVCLPPGAVWQPLPMRHGRVVL